MGAEVARTTHRVLTRARAAAVGKLVLFLADGTTLDIPLDRERTRIGRRPGTDLCLPYAAVSGEHAVIVTSASGATIEDLGSTNGTLVNGIAIARHELADGDRIDIGRQQLVYLENASAPAPPAPRRHASGRSHGVVRELPRRPSGPDLANEAAPAVPAIVVLSGPSAGRRLPLAKAESLVGRVGTQVAALRFVADGCRLFPIEGTVPPRVNGAAVGPEGALLRAGDDIEIAGAHLGFSLGETPLRRSPEIPASEG
jgi:hypothetical protein